ncbi:MAG: hypothetical protein CBD42_000160, partial [Gammaproteobacteria bacterium TMED182]
YKDAFKANYILNSPTVINPSSKNSNEVKLFVAAKEVETIDSYAANENIDKFDLVIDLGWAVGTSRQGLDTYRSGLR